MSFLLSFRVTSRRFLTSTYSSSHPSAAFHASPVLHNLRGTDINRDNFVSFYKVEKQGQVNGSQEVNAKWRAEFATESEADVKADRGEIETDDLAFQAIEEWTRHLSNRENPVNKIPCEPDTL